MSDKNTRLVYSTDPAQNQKCTKCKELLAECRCEKPQEVKSPNSKNYNFVAYLRIEKAGRGGKTVTAINDLPKNESFLKDLTSELKKKVRLRRHLLHGWQGGLHRNSRRQNGHGSQFAQ